MYQSAVRSNSNSFKVLCINTVRPYWAFFICFYKTNRMLELLHTQCSRRDQPCSLQSIEFQVEHGYRFQMRTQAVWQLAGCNNGATDTDSGCSLLLSRPHVLCWPDVFCFFWTLTVMYHPCKECECSASSCLLLRKKLQRILRLLNSRCTVQRQWFMVVRDISVNTIEAIGNAECHLSLALLCLLIIHEGERTQWVQNASDARAKYVELNCALRTLAGLPCAQNMSCCFCLLRLVYGTPCEQPCPNHSR
jgi:hypothetical protein